MRYVDGGLAKLTVASGPTGVKNKIISHKRATNRKDWLTKIQNKSINLFALEPVQSLKRLQSLEHRGIKRKWIGRLLSLWIIAYD